MELVAEATVDPLANVHTISRILSSANFGAQEIVNCSPIDLSMG